MKSHPNPIIRLWLPGCAVLSLLARHGGEMCACFFSSPADDNAFLCLVCQRGRFLCWFLRLMNPRAFLKGSMWRHDGTHEADFVGG